uniref:Myrosinase 1-like n=1 Tax=Diabrotica virgifera virgifera TaxID=50390 RepID=A0A6P7H7S1_DIAVI
MIEDCTRVYGYTYYSYIDGFEWNIIDGRLGGYTWKYGLYDVEFDCPQRTRTARSSAAYYQHLASTGCIDDP